MFTTTNLSTPRRQAMHADPDRHLRALRWRALLRWLLLTALVSAMMGAVVAVRAQSTPGYHLPIVQNLAEQGWRPVGEGSLRWFGFRVYRAALWTPAGQSWQGSGEFALIIEYQRDITAQRLVEASVTEMRRLTLADDTRISAWRPLLEQAFPDVVAGDVITGVMKANREVRFYHGNTLTAHVSDPEFGEAFFGIWLDAETREPGLRAQLLGDAGDG